MYIVTVQLSAYSGECGNVQFYGYRNKENAKKAFESYVNKYLGKLGFAPLDFEKLPQNALVFCIGKWEKIILENYNYELITAKLPRFLGGTPVYKIKGNENWCV